jgi:hypothetical protein
MAALILKHNCKNDARGNTAGAVYQDRIYGAGMRVFNPSEKKSEASCTVCGITVSIGSEDKKKAAEKSEKAAA